MYELSKQFRFEAAHTLQREVDAEPSRRIHGHSYRAEVVLRGVPDPQSGMMLDLGKLARMIEDGSARRAGPSFPRRGRRSWPCDAGKSRFLDLAQAGGQVPCFVQGHRVSRQRGRYLQLFRALKAISDQPPASSYTKV
jgi:hypothetical protein